MTNRTAEWSHTLSDLLALATRLEDEGQYNIAKLVRAAAEALIRQAAFKIALPSEKDKLAHEIKQAIDALSKLGVNEDILAVLKRGAAAMADGRLPLISDLQWAATEQERPPSTLEIFADYQTTRAKIIVRPPIKFV